MIARKHSAKLKETWDMGKGWKREERGKCRNKRKNKDLEEEAQTGAKLQRTPEAIHPSERGARENIRRAEQPKTCFRKELREYAQGNRGKGRRAKEGKRKPGQRKPKVSKCEKVGGNFPRLKKEIQQKIQEFEVKEQEFQKKYQAKGT